MFQEPVQRKHMEVLQKFRCTFETPGQRPEGLEPHLVCHPKLPEPCGGEHFVGALVHAVSPPPTHTHCLCANGWGSHRIIDVGPRNSQVRGAEVKKCAATASNMRLCVCERLQRRQAYKRAEGKGTIERVRDMDGKRRVHPAGTSLPDRCLWRTTRAGQPQHKERRQKENQSNNQTAHRPKKA